MQREAMQQAEPFLVRALTSGDREGLVNLYNLYWEPLFLYVVKVLNDEDESCDVVQETFIDLWEQRDRLADVKSLQSYLFAMARYKALRALRNRLKEDRFMRSFSAEKPAAEESPENKVMAYETEDFLNSAVACLPERMREVFVLSRHEKLTYQEIAHRLSISDKTVKKQISNALRFLRLKMNQHQMHVVWWMAVIFVYHA